MRVEGCGMRDEVLSWIELFLRLIELDWAGSELDTAHIQLIYSSEQLRSSSIWRVRAEGLGMRDEG
jgi:hypothetical protein